MAAVTDDLNRRRIGKASPEVRNLYEDLMALQGTGAEIGGPEFQALEARIGALSPPERKAFAELAESAVFGIKHDLEENQEVIDALNNAEKAFAMAHEKLRVEGKPIDPNMTLREAYEVLGLA